MARVLSGTDAARRSIAVSEEAVAGPTLDRLLAILSTGIVAPATDDAGSREQERASETVSWVSYGREGRLTLRRAPLVVAPLLRETLFDECESVVLTSATLAVAGSFDYLCERVGLPRARLEELVLPSPFDFLRQAVLCLPADMPEPSDPSFEESLVDVAAQTAIALSGRTLVLFTNSVQLQACAELLRQRLRDEGIKVLAQGKGGSSRRALADRFRADAQAVLLGTNSFWEGVDIPGSALSCVVIV